MKWIPLVSSAQLEALIERSKERLCLIFKHSFTCNISMMAKNRLEKGWSFSEEEIAPYFLDLHAFRALSNEVAERFEVFHESPQVLLIRQGQCVYDASHLDIHPAELKSAVAELAEH